jgi:hypothetical protein
MDLPAYAIIGPPLLALGLAYWLSRSRARRVAGRPEPVRA